MNIRQQLDVMQGAGTSEGAKKGWEGRERAQEGKEYSTPHESHGQYTKVGERTNSEGDKTARHDSPDGMHRIFTTRYADGTRSASYHNRRGDYEQYSSHETKPYLTGTHKSGAQLGEFLNQRFGIDPKWAE